MAAHPVSSKPLIDKLGVKPGMRVTVLGVYSEEFLEALRARTRDYTIGQPQSESDVVVYCALSRADLHRIERLAGTIKQNGAIWLVYPKGVQTVTESNVREAGLAAGLVDNKVVSFSPTQTALRFVVPLKDRKKSK